MTLKLSTTARAILKGYETGGKNVRGRLIVLPKGQPALQTYIDDAGVPTIGWGHTGRNVKPGMTITLVLAEAYLAEDIARMEAAVNRLIEGGAPTNQNQFDALVLLAFNIGPDEDSDHIAEGLGDSTLLKYHRAGKYDLAAKQFRLWNKITRGGKKVVAAGLVSRRAEEMALYTKPVEPVADFAPAPSPPVKPEAAPAPIDPTNEFRVEESKRVAPVAPTKPSRSPGVLGAIGATIPAGVVTVQGVSTANESLRQIKANADQVQQLGWLSGVLGIIIFLLASYIIYKKWHDHRNGVS